MLFSWRNELLLICACMLLSFLVAGFWFPYWRVADMDFFVVYNAFLLNTPLPQEFFDHPGYLSILLLSYWLRALHAVGLVHVQAFSAVPPLSDAAGFADAWTQATRAGRVLSLIYAMAFVLAFSYLLRALVRDWRVAVLGGFVLAFSGGMAMQMRMLRTELLSAGLFMIALLMLMVAAVRGPRAVAPAGRRAASLLITLALLNKVQVLFLIGALPRSSDLCRPRTRWREIRTRATFLERAVARLAGVRRQRRDRGARRLRGQGHRAHRA